MLIKKAPWGCLTTHSKINACMSITWLRFVDILRCIFMSKFYERAWSMTLSPCNAFWRFRMRVFLLVSSNKRRGRRLWWPIFWRQCAFFPLKCLWQCSVELSAAAFFPVRLLIMDSIALTEVCPLSFSISSWVRVSNFLTKLVNSIKLSKWSIARNRIYKDWGETDKKCLWLQMT